MHRKVGNSNNFDFSLQWFSLKKSPFYFVTYFFYLTFANLTFNLKIGWYWNGGMKVTVSHFIEPYFSDLYFTKPSNLQNFYDQVFEEIIWFILVCKSFKVVSNSSFVSGKWKFKSPSQFSEFLLMTFTPFYFLFQHLIIIIKV